MKNLLLLFLLFVGFGLQAQDANVATKTGKFSTFAPKLTNALSNFSVSATMGTPSFSMKEIGNINFKKISNVSIADLNISYKMNSRLSFGIDMMGSLGNCKSGYYTPEGTFKSFGDDDDDNDVPF